MTPYLRVLCFTLGCMISAYLCTGCSTPEETEPLKRPRWECLEEFAPDDCEVKLSDLPLVKITIREMEDID